MDTASAKPEYSRTAIEPYFLGQNNFDSGKMVTFSNQEAMGRCDINTGFKKYY